MLTSAQIIQLCSFSVLLAAGQIFFKLTAINAPPLNSLQGVLSLPTNIWFWGALVLYGTATLIWTAALQHVSLSIAYPFVAIGFVIVPLASYFIFKEPISWNYAAGVVLILVALKLITMGR